MDTRKRATIPGSAVWLKRNRIFTLGRTTLAALSMLLVFGVVACGAGEVIVQAPEQPAQAAKPAAAAPAAEPQKPKALVPTTPKPVGPLAEPRPTTGEPKHGGIAMIAHRGDPIVGWDPTRSRTVTILAAAQSIWGSGNLVRACPDDPYKRCLGYAEKWSVNDNLTEWTFKVRDDAKWHDGTPLTAADVKFWMDLSLNPPEGRPANAYRVNFAGPTKIEVLKGNQIRITLKQPTAGYLDLLGQPYMLIAHPRHLAQPEIDKGNVTVAPNQIGLIGAGPYKFKNYRKGSVISVRSFDGYWDKDSKGRKLPYLDGIDFPIIPDRETWLSAVRVGRVDAGARGVYITAGQKKILKNQFGDDIYFAGDARYSGRTVGFNTLREGPWQDLRVRKAISLWIDRAAMGQATRSGGGGRPATIWTIDSPFSNPDFMTWPGYNPATRTADKAEAKRLLAEAGYPNGFKTTFLCRSVVWVPGCEFLAEQMRTLGVDVTIDLRGIAELNAKICSGDYNITIGGSPGTAPFPEASRDRITDYKTNPCALARHDDPKVEELFDKLYSATSQQVRMDAAHEIERYVVKDKVYIITTHDQTYYQPVRAHLPGVLDSGGELCNYCDHGRAWLEK